MPTVGFEPTTTGLKGQQTAIVLSRHGVSTNLYTEKAFKPLLKVLTKGNQELYLFRSESKSCVFY